MILGYFHKGSGLGNQLFRYVATRALAKERGFDFGMIGPQNFKGSSFMSLDMGETPKLGVIHFDMTGRTLLPEKPQTNLGIYNEASIKDEFGNVIRGYDPEINFVEDNTIIDGEFQDMRYFEHISQKEMLGWFNIREDLMSDFCDEICVIGYRGGEFKTVPDLYLTKDYWEEAIRLIRLEKPGVVFKVVTDDPEEAKKVFPDFQVGNEIGDDWTSVLHAHYLIIANSSFYILPALLNKNAKKIIAPRYWARRNTRVWSTPQNYYKKFTYI